ncbi:uncharacterized protein MELLADRAFT_90434 [Melampsora larici-populina 98AG31]|uniref:Uncharacterized protein n=1 Tax=Melampsora larici-populina (strain 98AG31 / pathotype 3-4-7) TaxID=747676 RepID=F4RWX4_MELLP|nr:uncharacterized protein MELLADRAFT_90434 [Melampsora larici-populina 98AG31]EGG03099.1 hypothetical protein MELLADRAFT_90434 [Melampsora larici-populina 98AG31]
MHKVSEAYKAAMEADAVELVKDLGAHSFYLRRVGAKAAISFSANYRHASGGPSQPIQGIHSDMSPQGAKFVKDYVLERCLESKDPKEMEVGRYLQEGKHAVILNVWRPLGTVTDNHLGLCKWDSLSKEDALYSSITPTNGGNTLQRWQYRQGQRWFYLSEQKADDVYVFMQHDSRAADGHGVNVPHASFNLETDRNEAPKRSSYETRVIAIVT